MREATKDVKFFRGVYMRDNLPKKPYYNESGIVNLDSKNGRGSHWVAYIKRGRLVKYFDSFGNLQPPKELIKYFRGSEIRYNHDPYQTFGSFNCGHLCVEFLYQ